MLDELHILLENNGSELFYELLRKYSSSFIFYKDNEILRICIYNYKNNNYLLGRVETYKYIIARKGFVSYTIPHDIIDQITIDFKKLIKLKVFL